MKIEVTEEMRTLLDERRQAAAMMGSGNATAYFDGAAWSRSTQAKLAALVAEAVEREEKE